VRQPPLSLVRQTDTFRLLPSRFADQEDSVLDPLADNAAHLKDLFILDNATNQRLTAERGAMPGIGIDELVFGVPNFRIINAAYAYPRPEGSRFNDGRRGAWYCAFDVDTALAEVIFHKTVEYAEIDFFFDSVSYQVLLADFSAQFHDLRDGTAFKACLDPYSYVASQTLASQLLEAGSMGIVYPSVRRSGGTNIACFRPALVNNVRRGAAYQLTWSGSPEPSIQNKEHHEPVRKTPGTRRKR
jgi:RES domain-containing protein